jgi:hypothetical protein
MKQYALVNENRGVEIIAMLEALLASDIFNKLDNAPKFITKIILKTKNGKEFKLYKESVALIKELHHKQPNLALNHYLADNYLSLDEAVFCILGLNPKTVGAMNNNPRVINKKIKGVILQRFIVETAEGRGLSKAPRVEEESGFISDTEDKVYTDRLISWAIKNEFIEEIVEPKSNQKISTAPHQRSETIIQQKLINDLAKEEMIKYPKHTKSSLALDLSYRSEISIKEDTIRRDYLDKFPDF